MKREPRHIFAVALLIAFIAAAMGVYPLIALPAASSATPTGWQQVTPTPAVTKVLPLFTAPPDAEPTTSPPAADRAFQQQAEAALRRYLAGDDAIATSSITGTAPASWQVLTLPPTPISLETARAAAEFQMRATIAGDASGDWSGAKIVAEMTLYDLAGEVTAYHFVVHQAGQPAGYLTVAALSLPNQPITPWTANAPLSGNGDYRVYARAFLQADNLLPDSSLLLAYVGINSSPVTMTGASAVLNAPQLISKTNMT
jgi:hypothetical protein